MSSPRLFKPLVGAAILFGVFGMASATVITHPVSQPATELSKKQQEVVQKAISSMKTEEEKKAATGWGDAKKVAETICRPKAIQHLRKQYPATHDVTLGDKNPDSLKLKGNELLTGTGKFGEANNWRSFRFECYVDPETGGVSFFQATVTEPVAKPVTGNAQPAKVQAAPVTGVPAKAKP